MNMSNIDAITMRLVHYFVTKENYQPIIVNGLENEIWLENTDKKYGVIRINSNYIHNNEQLDFDAFKAKNIIKQIKKKTYTYGSTTLNILLNVGDNVRIEDNEYKKFEIITLNDIAELDDEDNDLISIFPELRYDVIDATNDMDFFINVTNDINETTEKKNKLFEKTFKKKRIVITNFLILVYVLVYILSVVGILNVNLFAMNSEYVKAGEWWRLFTATFFHADIIHLFCNCYSLHIVGTQLETVMGKWKFIVVYILSALAGCLLSGVLNGPYVTSIGASGAIFGLMGAMLYFGYHYRLYLNSVITSQLLPIIVANLVLGFALSGVDNYGHIGGLIGGLFAGMIVGVEGKSDKVDTKNGIIVTIGLFGFLIYMLFFR